MLKADMRRVILTVPKTGRIPSNSTLLIAQKIGTFPAPTRSPVEQDSGKIENHPQKM
ncbi:MAG: hypothetical protein MUO72_13630 [Bacteroidales bacterium]|nr:hypothetical protein [Bacteroidales bacterium]